MGCWLTRKKATAAPVVTPTGSVPPSPAADSQVSFGAVVSMLISAKDKLLLAHTWRRLSQNEVKLGMAVFKVVFLRQPKVKELFPFRDYSDHALAQHPLFRAHAGRFIGVIAATVESLDDLDGSVGPLLLTLGAQHADIRGFSVTYFEVFTQSLVAVWEGELRELWTPEVRAAWEKLFLFVMMELRAGYQTVVDGDASPESVASPQDSGQSMDS